MSSDCDNLQEAEKWRREIIKETTRKIAEIQNGACMLVCVRARACVCVYCRACWRRWSEWCVAVVSTHAYLLCLLCVRACVCACMDPPDARTRVVVGAIHPLPYSLINTQIHPSTPPHPPQKIPRHGSGPGGAPAAGPERPDQQAPPGEVPLAAPHQGECGDPAMWVGMYGMVWYGVGMYMFMVLPCMIADPTLGRRFPSQKPTTRAYRNWAGRTTTEWSPSSTTRTGGSCRARADTSTLVRA
jgi:hypothetical protein